MCFFKAKVEVNTLITPHFAGQVPGNNLSVLAGRQYVSINFSPVALIATADLKLRSVSAAVIFQFWVNIESSIKIINQ